jgi:ATP-dependent Clp protease protease subunit
MIHEPLLAGGVNGSASSIEKTAESILETKRVINELLARHSHKTVAEINEATAFDNYMNADEAIAFGLCDQIANILQDAAERSSI